MNRFLSLWRTTTVRLTAIFILIFVLAAVVLLAFIAYQSSIVIQRQQTADIEREVAQIQHVDQNQGIRGVALLVQRYARRPGPGIYYLADETGQMLVGNISDLPAYVLSGNGYYTFNYERDYFPAGPDSPTESKGFALARSVTLRSGLHLVVGRDIRERRSFSAIIFEGFFFGVLGIVVLSGVAGLLTSRRVLRRIDSIGGTARMIMSGSLSERVPVTKRNDEFDQLAISLNAMLDRIEQLMQGLKEVTDNVAHDLKTPLTRLRNRAEAALKEGRSPKEMRAALEGTITESDQLIRTFNALLMIARVEAGTPSGALSDIDLSALMTDLAELYAPVAEDAGITLDQVPGAPVHYHANRELIGQAVVNLIENAIKYAPTHQRAGTIALAVREVPGKVLIEVTDNGPGIPNGDRKRVVERFVRLEKSRTEAGSGLGLALVAAVAQMHKGELQLADNAPGLKAVIALPRAP